MPIWDDTDEFRVRVRHVRALRYTDTLYLGRRRRPGHRRSPAAPPTSPAHQAGQFLLWEATHRVTTSSCWRRLRRTCRSRSWRLAVSGSSHPSLIRAIFH
uniref:Uncharacterized protein n=1 Tax=Streptomyces sp. HK1 TaxID=405041 RepID=B0LU13_9ACTN|nr:unknown [Streptomyces sp. HK1]